MPVNFAKAVMRARVKPGKNPQLPNVGLRLNDVGLDAGHLAAYRKVCGFSDDGRLPVTYPHIHAFPKLHQTFFAPRNSHPLLFRLQDHARPPQRPRNARAAHSGVIFVMFTFLVPLKIRLDISYWTSLLSWCSLLTY